MQNLSLSEIATITQGQLFAPREIRTMEISKVTTDSRTYFKGENTLFFALSGPSHNGHDFIPQLEEKGLLAFVVSNKATISKTAAFILVEDTTCALQKLASHNRSQFLHPVIGITGSNGKTIVKEWLHDILSSAYNIIRSPKSYNSQVGVPLSVLLANNSFNLGIFEAGISQPEEMANLAEIIDPEIGILTNIGDAHQENFNSLQQKLKEKLLLFKKSKQLIFRADDSLTHDTTQDFCKYHSIKTISWSLEGKPALIQFRPNPNSAISEITASFKDQNYRFQIPFTEKSALENACHCFACLIALKTNINQFTHNFEALQSIAMRLEIKQGTNNCLLINDYYNSDLNSLDNALSVLKQQAAKGHLQKLVILSDIQQSGIPGEELYSRVNKLLQEWGIDELIGIGPEISKSANAFTIASSFFKNRLEFENHIKQKNIKSSAILLKGARNFEFEKIAVLLQQKAHQTVLEINLNALINNLTVFRGLLKANTKVMVMVKAFSYGSGDVEIARLLQYMNVDYLAVAVADEGVQLRNAGISLPIVVMNPEQDSFQNIIDYNLEPNIYSIDLLKAFSKSVSSNVRQRYPIHIKIDSGMNRLGLKTDSEIREAIGFLNGTDNLLLTSTFSHLAASDEPELDSFTQEQFKRFEKCYKLISKLLPYKIERHILNSAGIERFGEYQYDMVRLGIGLYGISQTGLPLENIGTLKSTISQIKTVESCETVGYNRKGILKQCSKIAVVPMGYADGLDRKLGNKNGHAFVKGQRLAIVGNICMDMLMLDVTNINVHAGDEVEFFGPNIPISELAEKTDTIPYEILTGISQRVKRVYLQE